MLCRNVLPLVSNRTGTAEGQQVLPAYMRQLFAAKNLTFHGSQSIAQCMIELTPPDNHTNHLSALTPDHHDNHQIRKYSTSLLTFVVLIGLVSIISIIGNLCLAKVIYAKRFRLIQTDRIVLCLALSKLITRRRSLPARYPFPRPLAQVNLVWFSLTHQRKSIDFSPTPSPKNGCVVSIRSSKPCSRRASSSITSWVSQKPLIATPTRSKAKKHFSKVS